MPAAGRALVVGTPTESQAGRSSGGVPRTVILSNDFSRATLGIYAIGAEFESQVRWRMALLRNAARRLWAA